MGLNMEHITIQADVDEVNISDEMSRTALWKSIVDNKPLAGVCIQNEHDAVGHNTGAKSRSVLTLLRLPNFHVRCTGWVSPAMWPWIGYWKWSGVTTVNRLLKVKWCDHG